MFQPDRKSFCTLSFSWIHQNREWTACGWSFQGWVRWKIYRIFLNMIFLLLRISLKCIICVSGWGNSLPSATHLPNSEFPEKCEGQLLTLSFTGSWPLCFYAHETASSFTHEQLKLFYGFHPKVLTLLSLNSPLQWSQDPPCSLMQISALWRFVETS